MGTAALLWLGCLRMVMAVGSTEFARARAPAVVGLTFGLLVVHHGICNYRGEWFAMWQSAPWNGQHKVFEFISMIAGVLVVVLIPEVN